MRTRLQMLAVLAAFSLELVAATPASAQLLSGSGSTVIESSARFAENVVSAS